MGGSGGAFSHEKAGVCTGASVVLIRAAGECAGGAVVEKLAVDGIGAGGETGAEGGRGGGI